MAIVPTSQAVGHNSKYFANSKSVKSRRSNKELNFKTPLNLKELPNPDIRAGPARIILIECIISQHRKL